MTRPRLFSISPSKWLTVLNTPHGKIKSCWSLRSFAYESVNRIKNRDEEELERLQQGLDTDDESDADQESDEEQEADDVEGDDETQKLKLTECKICVLNCLKSNQ